MLVLFHTTHSSCVGGTTDFAQRVAVNVHNAWLQHAYVLIVNIHFKFNVLTEQADAARNSRIYFKC